MRPLASVLILALLAACARGQPAEEADAVARGLAWLARQQRDDGSFQRDGPRLAITALATLAFLADGHAPDVGRYGLILRRAINHLIEQTPADGYIGRVDNSRMYGQAIVAIALIEAASLESDAGPRRAALETAARLIDVIVRAQQIDKPAPHAGGWRYQPDSADSDLSVTHWCLIALRSARSAGLGVPGDAIDRATRDLRHCLNHRTG
ncbi:MAG TPA: terpene cyclase/mutase family protein, partial [Tepidisphaeraceae bacterium]|nr:terpene cyclase/mutase family protein [Tepidisphaeraceae bacterium]